MKKLILLLLPFHLATAMVENHIIDEKQKNLNGTSTISKRREQVRTLSVIFKENQVAPNLREIAETNDEALFARFVLYKPNCDLTTLDGNNENIVHYLVGYKCRSLLSFLFASKKFVSEELKSKLINQINKDSETPLDLAHAIQIESKNKNIKLGIIEILKKNGALSALELKEQEKRNARIRKKRKKNRAKRKLAGA